MGVGVIDNVGGGTHSHPEITIVRADGTYYPGFNATSITYAHTDGENAATISSLSLSTSNLGDHDISSIVNAYTTFSSGALWISLKARKPGKYRIINDKNSQKIEANFTADEVLYQFNASYQTITIELEP